MGVTRRLPISAAAIALVVAACGGTASPSSATARASAAAAAAGSAPPSAPPASSAAAPTVEGSPATSAPAAASPSGPPPSEASPSGPAPSGSATPGASGAIDPANFTTEIDNPWFPLKPGTTFVYHGTKDGQRAVDTVTVTNDTKVIAGVTTRVISDRLTLDGKLAERTFDYYAQDLQGNVWYFGEDTRELDENGKVTSTEGSWRAGVDGARPGIYMEAEPTVGKTVRQEYLKGEAEDRFQVIDLAGSVDVPYGSFRDVLKTREWTPLEPGVIDNKFFVYELGQVKEVTAKGPEEETVLVKVDEP